MTKQDFMNDELRAVFADIRPFEIVIYTSPTEGASREKIELAGKIHDFFEKFGYLKVYPIVQIRPTHIRDIQYVIAYKGWDNKFVIGSEGSIKTMMSLYNGIDKALIDRSGIFYMPDCPNYGEGNPVFIDSNDIYNNEESRLDKVLDELSALENDDKMTLINWMGCRMGEKEETLKKVIMSSLFASKDNPEKLLQDALSAYYQEKDKKYKLDVKIKTGTSKYDKMKCEFSMVDENKTEHPIKLEAIATALYLTFCLSGRIILTEFAPDKDVKKDKMPDGQVLFKSIYRQLTGKERQNLLEDEVRSYLTKISNKILSITYNPDIVSDFSISKNKKGYYEIAAATSELKEKIKKKLAATNIKL